MDVLDLKIDTARDSGTILGRHSNKNSDRQRKKDGQRILGLVVLLCARDRNLHQDFRVPFGPQEGRRVSVLLKQLREEHSKCGLVNQQSWWEDRAKQDDFWKCLFGHSLDRARYSLQALYNGQKIHGVFPNSDQDEISESVPVLRPKIRLNRPENGPRGTPRNLYYSPSRDWLKEDSALHA